MKITKAAALITVLLSNNAFAIQNGESVPWEQHQSVVNMNCTGTVLSGNRIITAAHCSWKNTGGLRDVSSFLGTPETDPKTVEQIEYSSPDGKFLDIAIWKLNGDITTNEALLLSINPIEENDQITVLGMGGDLINNSLLKKGLFSAQENKNKSSLNLSVIGEGQTEPGDSGSPYINKAGSIVGIHNGSSSDQSNGTKITAAKDFILENVNAWHYPTTAKTKNGTVIITAQSLHKDDVSDTAYTEGDATITGGSCVGSSVIKPFDTCTYEVSSNGAEGKLILGANDTVTINKTVKPDPKPQPDNNNSSGGGSLGLLSLMALFLLGFKRNK